MTTARRTCKDCGDSIEDRGAGARQCAVCATLSSHAQQAELARLRLARGRCTHCGEPIEVDRSVHATICYWCQPNSALLKAMGDFARPGIWAIGPVVVDWDEAVSVARCEECSFSVMRIGERGYRTATNHASLWHGYRGKAQRLPELEHDFDEDLDWDVAA